MITLPRRRACTRSAWLIAARSHTSSVANLRCLIAPAQRAHTSIRWLKMWLTRARWINCMTTSCIRRITVPIFSIPSPMPSGLPLLKDGELYVTEDFAHVLTDVSDNQFQSRLITAFNRLRASKGLAPVAVRSDAKLEKAACNAKLQPRTILRQLPGATNLTMFTASRPDDLPSNMQEAAVDGRLRRMSIGVCFKPDQKGGFSTYWVAAAFYPNP